MNPNTWSTELLALTLGGTESEVKVKKTHMSLELSLETLWLVLEWTLHFWSDLCVPLRWSKWHRG